MKKLTFLLFLFIGIQATSNAQMSEKPRNGWGFGFQLAEWGNDFGFGFSINSPEYFQFLSVDLTYQQQFRSNYVDATNPWEPYGIVQFGVRSKGGQITDWFHLYGFGRVSYLAVGPADWNVGAFSGSGGFGFEFNTHASGQSPVSYFIEMGGTGGFETAADEPSVAGGFNSTVGLRVVF
ncbi:MAG: hypothetical protein HWE14_02630 [Flavobacteriia bacterium]|nr:hypothetical protein [Flavobacteriia bacterium]